MAPQFITWNKGDEDVEAPEGYSIDFDRTTLTASGYKAPLVHDTPADFPCCSFCTRPGSFARRDTSGTKYRACGEHTRDLEIMVREINEWDSVALDTP